jgi:8-oxo-dGTP diphosphatase
MYIPVYNDYRFRCIVVRKKMEQILVTAGVIAENGRFLMAKRLPQGPEGGKWEFPGGKIEPGENPRCCLQRELIEELGVQVEVGGVLDVVSSSKVQRHVIIIYFQCRIIAGEPQTIECQEVAWLSPTQITLLEKPENDEKFWNQWQKQVLTF